MHRSRSAALIVCFLLVRAPLGAHPHMWIDTKVTFRFAEEGLAGFTVEWTFDDLNSASLIETYDGNRDGSLSPAEIEKTRTGGFEHLYDWNYFLRLEVDGKERKPERGTEFTARIERGLLTYTFFMPMKVDVSSRASSIGVIVMDETFFVDFRIPEGGIAADAPADLDARASLGQVRQTASAGWVVTLQQVQLRLQRNQA